MRISDWSSDVCSSDLLDLDAVQKAVAARPWVESVEARKHWPDTLQLRIYERQPFARWNDKQLISRQGLVFDAPDMADIGALPDLRGPDARLAEVVSFYAETRKAFAGTQLQINGVRSEESRVGTERVSKFNSRWS